jgi:hypothetical protein
MKHNPINYAELLDADKSKSDLGAITFAVANGKAVLPDVAMQVLESASSTLDLLHFHLANNEAELSPREIAQIVSGCSGMIRMATSALNANFLAEGTAP